MKQAARCVWALSFVLAACGQSPTPATPGPSDDATSGATMSTEADDAAKRIFIDAEGGSYVLGAAGPSVFLNHYRIDGSLVWRVDAGIKTCDACHTLDVRLVEETIYILTLEGATLTLSTFSPEGAKVSSQALRATGEQVTTGSLDSSGRSHLLSLTRGGEGTTWYLDVLNARGEKAWSKSSTFATVTTSYSESTVALALAPDDSTYLAAVNALQKYDSAGTLLWSKAFDFSNETHVQANLAVGSDGSAYLFRDLASGGDFVAYNVEVQRFSPEGDALWTQNLFKETLASRFHYPEIALFAASPSGAVLMTRKEHYLPEGESLPDVSFNALYKIMPDGAISSGVNMGAARIYDMAFSPFEEDQPSYVGLDAKVGYLFMAGSSVRAEGTCYDPEDESTGSPYCPDTDALMTEYRHFSINQEVTAESDVVWTRY